MNAHNGEHKLNLRHKKEGVERIVRRAGNSESWDDNEKCRDCSTHLKSWRERVTDVMSCNGEAVGAVWSAHKWNRQQIVVVHWGTCWSKTVEVDMMTLTRQLKNVHQCDVCTAWCHLGFTGAVLCSLSLCLMLMLGLLCLLVHLVNCKYCSLF